MPNRKRERKTSDPVLLAARMERAHAEGVPMDLDYDEVTGVIDVALQRARAGREASIEKVRELVRKLDTGSKPPTGAPA